MKKIKKFFKTFSVKAGLAYSAIAGTYAAAYFGIATLCHQPTVLRDVITGVIAVSIMVFAIRAHYAAFNEN